FGASPLLPRMWLGTVAMGPELAGTGASARLGNRHPATGAARDDAYDAGLESPVGSARYSSRGQVLRRISRRVAGGLACQAESDVQAGPAGLMCAKKTPNTRSLKRLQHAC